MCAVISLNAPHAAILYYFMPPSCIISFRFSPASALTQLCLYRAYVHHLCVPKGGGGGEVQRFLDPTLDPITQLAVIRASSETRIEFFCNFFRMTVQPAAFEQRYRIEDSRFRLLPPHARCDHKWIMVHPHPLLFL